MKTDRNLLTKKHPTTQLDFPAVPAGSQTAPACMARALAHLLARHTCLWAALGLLSALAFGPPPAQAAVTEAWVHRYSNVVICVVKNSIVYYNSAPLGSNYFYGPTLNSCCSIGPEIFGSGNITNEPAFVDLAGGDLRLQSNSPCINAGNNIYVTGSLDLDGNPRIAGGTVDMGAYEFQAPGSLLSYAWLQQYGLPTDGSADHADNDRDTRDNWQEWRCGTDPTNALSALRLLSPEPFMGHLLLRWESVSGKSYYLERSTNLMASPPFLLLATNLTGEAGTTLFVDPDVMGSQLCFYRIGVP